MNKDTVLALIVLVPVFGSLLLPLVGRLSSELRNYLALALVLVSFAGSLVLLQNVGAGEVVNAKIYGFNLFYADRLAVFMALVSSFLGAIIILYSFGYIAKYDHQNEYYLMAVLFLGAMMGLVYSRNLLMLYTFWEITAFACWRLIGFFRDRTIVWKANKAFLITVTGALTMLIGFIVIYGQTGSFDLLISKEFLANQPVSSLAVCLILFGLLSKSATVPFHSWLPDAGVAPSPVTALLHAAVLVKIGCYVYARLFVASFGVESFWHVVVPGIAGFSAIVSAGAAIVETDIKRIIAYSTISQLAFIILGLSIGTPLGVAGGLIYILMHGVSKGGLFLCAGIVEQRTHIKDVNKLGGLMEVMPLTAAAFVACSFSIMGIPPFGGFFAKFMVIAGTVNSGQMWTAAIFIFGACLTMIYLFRAFNLVFLGNTKLQGSLSSFKEGSSIMVFSVVLLAVLSLAGGVFFNYPSEFVLATVKQMMGQ